jgi:uncharacterized protein
MEVASASQMGCAWPVIDLQHNDMNSPWLPIHRKQVVFTDGFWKKWTDLVGDVSLNHEYLQMKFEGQVDALSLNPLTHRGRKAEDEWYWGGSIFWDSDLAKWLEAASAKLERGPDPDLERLVDDTIERFSKAQMPDGYVNSHILTWRPNHRFKNLRDLHELYCAGHLIEAAVVHHEATSKTTLLDVVCRYADYLVKRFGPDSNKLRGYCGHPEIELALFRLYRLTKQTRYFELARFFIEERGREPNYFDEEAIRRVDARPFRPNHPGSPYAYMQADRPIRSQDHIAGHAVRAMYLYSAVADLAAETGDSELLEVCRKIWDDVCSTKLYLTGGIGSAAENEGFTSGYDLPNEKAYAETCASIGLFQFAHRLLHFGLDSQFGNVMEIALYNNILSGIGLDGKSFFYENPLSSRGHHHRLPWPWWCPCCPPNLARLILTLPGYLYSQRADTVAIHLLVSSQVNLSFFNTEVTLQVKSDLPFHDQTELIVKTARPAEFSVAVRIPDWAGNPQVRVNGEKHTFRIEKGYLTIRRLWERTSTVELVLELSVRKQFARYEIEADRGRVALSRGPFIYCLESIDNGEDLDQILIPEGSSFAAVDRPDLLGGITVLEGAAVREAPPNNALYSTEFPKRWPISITAVPYYAWDNREPAEMQVWNRSMP